MISSPVAGGSPAGMLKEIETVRFNDVDPEDCRP